ncbi:SCO family protein [Niabella terrae]
MKKSRFYYVLFFVVLAIGFYYLVSYLIPGYSDKKITPISKVAAFNFTNQDGQPFSNQDVDGKVYVAEFFFTTCPGICPMMNANLRQVYEKFRGQPDFRILSYTCDPQTDSASRLRQYADSMGVDTRQWVFLTGRKDSLYNMARLSYTIDDPTNNLTRIEDDFLHTQHWALVSRKGEVLRIYDGLKEKEIEQLVDDIQQQLKL